MLSFKSLSVPVFLAGGHVGSIVAYGYGAIANVNTMDDTSLYGTINETGIQMGGWRYAGDTSFPTITGGPGMTKMRFGAGTFDFVAVPEPAAWALGGLGLAVLAGLARKRLG